MSTFGGQNVACTAQFSCTILHHMHPGRSSWNELQSGDNMFLSCKTWEVLCLYFWFQYQLGWDSHFRTDISMVTSIAGLRLFPGLAWKKPPDFPGVIGFWWKMFYKQVMMRWFGLTVSAQLIFWRRVQQCVLRPMEVLTDEWSSECTNMNKSNEINPWIQEYCAQNFINHSESVNQSVKQKNVPVGLWIDFLHRQEWSNSLGQTVNQ